jgi:hypothetical protein
MPKYAQYDPSVVAPAPVIGWYDTDILQYPNLPAASDLLELSEVQWEGRTAGPSCWAVSAGDLVAYTPPVPPLTLAQQAAVLIAGGLTITSGGTPALNGTYAADPQTVSYINSELNAIMLNGTFADGAATVEWPDAAGALHTFNVVEFKALASALGAFVAGIRKCVIGVSGAALPPAGAAIA